LIRFSITMLHKIILHNRIGRLNRRKSFRPIPIKRVVAIFLILVAVDVSLFAQVPHKIYNFNIHGLQLNMDLDKVIKLYNINNINTNKDARGHIIGYEVRKRINQQKTMIVLNFTGEKRLYRIHHSKIYEKFKYQSKDLYGILVSKYGKPWSDNVSAETQKNKNISACWGSSCKKFPRVMPTLTAQIHHASGRLKLMLSDNRIFNRDWKIYKQKLAGEGKDKDTANRGKGENETE
jgi:hypothetical protein